MTWSCPRARWPVKWFGSQTIATKTRWWWYAKGWCPRRVLRTRCSSRNMAMRIRGRLDRYFKRRLMNKERMMDRCLKSLSMKTAICQISTTIKTTFMEIKMTSFQQLARHLTSLRLTKPSPSLRPLLAFSLRRTSRLTILKSCTRPFPRLRPCSLISSCNWQLSWNSSRPVLYRNTSRKDWTSFKKSDVCSPSRMICRTRFSLCCKLSTIIARSIRGSTSTTRRDLPLLRGTFCTCSGW